MVVRFISVSASLSNCSPVPEFRRSRENSPSSRQAWNSFFDSVVLAFARSLNDINGMSAVGISEGNGGT